MWGLGIVLFELLFGVLPWGMKQSEETVRWIDEFDDKGEVIFLLIVMIRL